MEFHIYGTRDYEIKEALRLWREVRNLTVEGQRQGFRGNIAEELSEFYRAANSEEQVDAVCDMIIFGINIIEEEFSTGGNALYTLQKAMFPAIKETITVDTYVNAIWRIMSSDAQIGYVGKALVALCLDLLEFLGYDSRMCVEETIQELSSRTGHYDKNIGKFVKDTSPEAQAKWYKADYIKCRKGDK